jgi:hypothetical protein
MEMMDTQAAVRWFDDSVAMMTAMRKRRESRPKSESHPKAEIDPLRRELIAAARDFIEALLESSNRVAFAIHHQMALELPLLLAHPEALAALRRAENLYEAESEKAWLAFKQTCSDLP